VAVRRQIGGSAAVLAVVGILVAAPPSGAALLGGGGLNLNLPGRTSGVVSGLTGGSSGGLSGAVGGVVGTVGQVVGQVAGAVTGVVGSALPSAVDPTAGYQPTLDDSANPHGEGTVAAVTIGAGVVPAIPGVVGSDGQIVVGRSLGEYQTTTKQFHGHITVLSLFGQEILGVDTLPGQSVSGVLGTQQATLDQICAESMNTICLKLLDESSTTTATSSTNHFEAAGVGVGAATPVLAVGPLALADAAYSDGDISVNPATGCETTHGDAHVGDLSLVGLTVKAIDSESDSSSCNNPASSAPTTSASQVASLGGSVLPLASQIPLVGSALAVPVVAPAACSSGGPAAFGNSQSGTPNVDAGIPVLLPVICNADDTNLTGSTGQSAIPYTAREALTAFVLSLTPSSGLAKVTAAASQASSSAPGAIGTTTGTTTGSTTGTTGTTTGSTTGTTTGTTAGTTTGTTAGTTTGTTATVTATTPAVTTTAPSSTGNTTGTTGNTTGSTGNTTGTTGNTTGTTGNTTATPATPKAAATLPFTGFNVLWLLVGGVTMLTGGLTLRRFAPRRGR
jgi:hypothetical protein